MHHSSFITHHSMNVLIANSHCIWGLYTCIFYSTEAQRISSSCELHALRTRARARALVVAARQAVGSQRSMGERSAAYTMSQRLAREPGVARAEAALQKAAGRRLELELALSALPKHKKKAAEHKGDEARANHLSPCPPLYCRPPSHAPAAYAPAPSPAGGQPSLHLAPGREAQEALGRRASAPRQADARRGADGAAPRTGPPFLRRSILWLLLVTLISSLIILLHFLGHPRC